MRLGRTEGNEARTRRKGYAAAGNVLPIDFKGTPLNRAHATRQPQGRRQQRSQE
jgi:hypothetical protein